MLTSIIELAFRNLLFFALHLDSAGNFPRPLTKVEEADCITRMTDGTPEEIIKARSEIIEHNLRLVAYLVKRYYADSREPDDLISIGMIGLIKAAKTFKPARNASFSTYASKCIDNEIKMHFRKIKHQQGEILLGDPIDTDDQGNEITIGDKLGDTACVIDEAFLRIHSQKLYRSINEALNPRERQIICLRYGLPTTCGNGITKIMTQREVSAYMGISRSYVSRIEKRALEKLRHAINTDS